MVNDGDDDDDDEHMCIKSISIDPENSNILLDVLLVSENLTKLVKL